MLKRSVVIKPKRLKPIKWDYEIIILFTLFFCGVILGVFLVKSCDNDIRKLLTEILKNYISEKSDCSFLACFSGILFFMLFFVFSGFIFGLCAVGTPLIWLLPVIFGGISGCYVSLMLINYGIKGLFYCILVDLVVYAITTATLVKCCCESTRLSVDLFSCIAGKGNIKSNCMFNEYVLNYLVLCIPIIIGALISTFLFKVFQSLFIFA